MLVLMREDLAQELGAPIKAELLAYSLSADGYHPTAPRPDGSGAGRAIRAALAAAGVEPERGQLRQLARHRHGQERPGGDGRDQVRPRRARLLDRGLLHQVDDRAPAGRGRRGREHRHRARDRDPDGAADGQLHDRRPRVRPRLRAQRGAADEHRRRGLQQLRLRRRERVDRVGQAGRAPRAARARPRPRGDHRDDAVHQRRHRRRGALAGLHRRRVRLRGRSGPRGLRGLRLPEAQGAQARRSDRAVLRSSPGGSRWRTRRWRSPTTTASGSA